VNEFDQQNLDLEVQADADFFRTVGESFKEFLAELKTIGFRRMYLKVSSDYMITKGHSDRRCGTSSSTRLPNSKYPLWIPVKQQGASGCCQKGKSITRN
jgi:hypothetical protein